MRECPINLGDVPRGPGLSHYKLQFQMCFLMKWDLKRLEPKAWLFQLFVLCLWTFIDVLMSLMAFVWLSIVYFIIYVSHLVLMSFVEEAFGLGVLMSLVEVIFLHRKRNSGVGGGVQCPTGRVFQYRVGYWKSFMTPFLHSRTTFKNRPPLDSTFWNRSNLVMYDNIYVGFSSSRAGAELGIDEEAVSKWPPSTIRSPSQK